jgi:hypothetical protein
MFPVAGIALERGGRLLKRISDIRAPGCAVSPAERGAGEEIALLYLGQIEI